MHNKHIKLIIREQLKNDIRIGKALLKKKRVIAKKVLAEAIKPYDFTQHIEASIEELFVIEEQFKYTILR